MFGLATMAVCVSLIAYILWMLARRRTAKPLDVLPSVLIPSALIVASLTGSLTLVMPAVIGVGAGVLLGSLLGIGIYTCFREASKRRQVSPLTRKRIQRD